MQIEYPLHLGRQSTDLGEDVVEKGAVCDELFDIGIVADIHRLIRYAAGAEADARFQLLRGGVVM